MIKILEADGKYSRMEAIKKIVNDHNDLPGFSQRTIYNQLPEDMKSKELGRPNLQPCKLGEPNNNNDTTINYDYEEEEEKEQEEIEKRVSVSTIRIDDNEKDRINDILL